jgi:hypothetical protein
MSLPSDRLVSKIFMVCLLVAVVADLDIIFCQEVRDAAHFKEVQQGARISNV